MAKLVTKVGSALTIEMPCGQDEMSLGYTMRDAVDSKQMTFAPRFCFLEMDNPKQAQKVVEILEGYKLDKSHVFSAMGMEVAEHVDELPIWVPSHIPLQDYQKYISMPDEFTPPATKEFTEKECLISWLMDEQVCSDATATSHSPMKWLWFVGTRSIRYHAWTSTTTNNCCLLERNQRSWKAETYNGSRPLDRELLFVVPEGIVSCDNAWTRHGSVGWRKF